MPFGSPAEKKESTGRSREFFDGVREGSRELDGPELGAGELGARLRSDRSKVTFPDRIRQDRTEYAIF